MIRQSMRTRILLGGLMVLLLAGVIVLDAWWEKHFNRNLRPDEFGPQQIVRGIPIGAVLAVLLGIGFYEFSRLARQAGVWILWVSGLLGVLLLATQPILRNIGLRGIQSQTEPMFGPLFPSKTFDQFVFLVDPAFLLMVLLAAMFLEQMIRARLTDAFRRIAATMLAIAYLGLGGYFILSLLVRFGVGWLVLFLAAVKCMDIGAYFAGSFFGKHKLIAWLSPGKTWEGLAGGVAATVLVSLLGWALRGVLMQNGFPLREWWEHLVFCVTVGLAGQFGDLCESLLKRSAGVKDAGSAVPEFGGVLDILDSPLLAAPAAYALMVLLA
jgi:CDP-diglyceride synthetase